MCYCDSGLAKEVCCEPLLQGVAFATTPLALMRSRYSAFVTRNQEYLASTVKLEALKSWQEVKEHEWLEYTKLEIIDYTQVSSNQIKGCVEFKAYYQYEGELGCLHERSQFQKIAGKWYYIKGRMKK